MMTVSKLSTQFCFTANEFLSTMIHDNLIALKVILVRNWKKVHRMQPTKGQRPVFMRINDHIQADVFDQHHFE